MTALRTPRRPSRFIPRAGFGILFLCFSSTLNAAPVPVPVPIPAIPTNRLSLWLDVGHSGLDKAAVRAAIEQELGAPVELTDTASTPLRVIVDSEQRLRVAFTTASGEELSRTVDLPGDPARRVEVIALMVGNLTRNEAADLLAALQAAKRPPPAPPAPPAPPRASKPQSAPSPEPDPLLPTRAPALDLSLFHPISLYPSSHRRRFHLELGLAYSRVGAIEGAGWSFGALKVEQHVHGVAFGGLVSIVDGPVRGAHASFLYAEGRAPLLGAAFGGLVLHRGTQPLTGVGIGGLVELGGDVEGLSLGGLVDVSHAVKGAAIGGLVTVARGPVEGLLIGGLFTSSLKLQGITLSGLVSVSGDSEGLAFSGLGNLSGRLDGVAIGGLANVTGDVHGFAMSGLANVTGDVHGAALSLVNVGQTVHGAQVGLVNVAGEVDGAQIGLVNLAKNGRVQAQAFASNFMPVNAGVRFVSGYSYSELSFGYSPGAQAIEYSGGLGAHFELGQLSLETGLHGSSTQQPRTSETPTRVDLHYRGRVSYRLASFLEPFVGGGARHGLYGLSDGKVEPEVLAGLALF